MHVMSHLNIIFSLTRVKKTPHQNHKTMAIYIMNYIEQWRETSRRKKNAMNLPSVNLSSKKTSATAADKTAQITKLII